MRVVRVVEEGMTQARAAEVFGVSRAAVNGWCQRSRTGGQAALRSKKRGRPARPRLAAKHAERVVRTILTRCPDQLRLPFALWTREAVQQLLAERFGLRVSVWTVGRYLKTWGLTPQKPLRRAYEQNPEAVERWLQTEYPAIQQRAQAEGAEIHWGDEMGLRSDHQVGTTYGLRGKTPTMSGTGQRFRCNVISTVSNRGKLAFMVFGHRFTGPVFLEFLERLLRHRAGRKVFVIVDRHPVHRAARVARWVERRRDRIELFFLPPYSPELNPDELLNQDVKSNAVGRRRPSTVSEMVTTVRGYLRSTQKQPSIVRSYFRHPKVRYAGLPELSTESCSR